MSYREFLTLVLLGLAATPALPDEPIVVTGLQPGQRVFLEVAADSKGKVTLRQLSNVIAVSGDSPAPGPTPDPTDPPPSPIVAEVHRLTQAALAAGGSKTTGAALSSIYTLVADGVGDGTISPSNALPSVRAATDLVLAQQADRASWDALRNGVGESLTLQQQLGALSTKEQYVSTLRAIAAGLDKATGFTGHPSAVSNTRSAGLLDGFDITRLIELVRFIMELLKLFKG